MQPIIFTEGEYTEKTLNKFRKNNPIWKTVDVYEQQLKELFEITYPQLKASPQFKQKQKKFLQDHLGLDPQLKGNWIYLPWSGIFLHNIKKQDYYTLRTNRNKNLINENEQEKLNNFSVGIIGLSVGSGIATGLAYQGIAREMKLAEFDTLETSNLNRIRAGAEHIGIPKIQIAAEQIYEINPYQTLHLYPQGLTKKNIKDFIYTKPQPKVIFEIIDDFEMKILLRLEARKAGIPVIMMANLGDSILIDIERFDRDQNLPLFNGAIGNLPEEILKNPLADKNKYAVQIVGIENVPSRAMESVKEIGKTLVGRPQLSSTVAIGGGLATYIVRCLALKKHMPNGRIRVLFDKLFE